MTRPKDHVIRVHIHHPPLHRRRAEREKLRPGIRRRRRRHREGQAHTVRSLFDRPLDD